MKQRLNPKSLLLTALIGLLIFYQNSEAQVAHTKYGFNAGSSGNYGTYIGYYAGFSTTSSYNTFLGAYSGRYNTTGYYNTFLGTYSGYRTTTGGQNVFLGYRSGYSNISGASNIAVGHETGYKLTTGSSNVLIGQNAGWHINSEAHNVAVGFGSGQKWNSNYNVGLGSFAGYGNGGTGGKNLYLGYQTGYSTSSGSSNIFIGYQSGRNATGSSNVFLGYQAGYSETGSNRLYIDNSSTSSPLIWGDFSANRIKINGQFETTGDTYFLGDINTTRKGISGTYNSSQVQGIWSISSNYSINEGSNTFGTQYGLAYAHTNSGHGVSGWGHQILFTQNGVMNSSISLGGNGYFKGNVGIGTTNPSEKLEVNGNIKSNDIIASNLTLTNNLTLNNNLLLNPANVFPDDNLENLLVMKPDGSIWKRNVSSIESPWLLEFFSPDSLSCFAPDLGIDIDVFDLNGNLRIGDDAYFDDDIEYGDNGPGNDIPDDWMKFSGRIEFKSSSTNHGIVLWDRNSFAQYLNIHHSSGVSYFTNNTDASTYFMRADGQTMDFPGAVGIGVTNNPSGYKLAVDGKIIAEEIKVELSTTWPDYVFSSNYDLMPLNKVKEYIKAEKHLPNVPSAHEIKKDGGVELGEMNRKLMEKVEELTLYLIQEHDRIDEIQKELSLLKAENETLKKQLSKN